MDIETVNKHCKHKDCRYRQHVAFLGECCLYMLYTGNSRSCDISECDKYAPGYIKKIMTLDGVIYRCDDDV